MKKILIVLIGISFVFSLEVFAQKKTTAKKQKSPKTQPAGKVNSGGQKEFISTEGKFKILFPASPTIKTDEYGEGDFRMRKVAHRTYSGATGYVVTVTDSFSKAAIDDAKNLESLHKLILTSGKFVKETKLTLGEIAGWEVVYQKTDQSILHHRVYSLGKRWYEIIVVYPSLGGETPDTAMARNKTEVSKFFDSFQIIN